MCGIAGRFNFRSGAPVDALSVRRMCRLVAHRGPDAEDVLVNGSLGLGHRRLAIIDLSPAGRQPMSTPDGRLTIVFNGEIYNYQSLRVWLEQRGHRFRTSTDTEVLLAAYAELGLEALGRLRGMFAFAIWDAKDRSLLLVRDRVGKKPLHYRIDRDGIAFASEPKAFFADAGFDAQPDLQAIGLYLACQYVPSPESAFRGVRKLQPGHALLVRNGRVEVRRYWQLAYTPKVRIDERAAEEEVSRRLTEAVRLRMISDVPLGAFLSGGIDSGVVVALMARMSSQPVRTFSIGFDEQEYNELPQARAVARRYETDHHEFVVRPSAIELLPRLVWHYNEPYADESAIPTLYLSDLTRQHVTVALNGDGGDEDFGGYTRYLTRGWLSRYDRLPSSVQRAIQLGGRWLPRDATGRMGMASRWLARAGLPLPRRYVRRLMQLDPELQQVVCTPEFLKAAPPYAAEDRALEAWRSAASDDALDAMLATDVATYLPDCLLVKVDIASMAASLEARSPFLDHEVMELAASLPSDLKIRGSRTKHLLREIARPLLPDELIDRPKMGFGVPLDRWFRTELRDLTRDLLLNGRFAARGICRPEQVSRLVEQHETGQAEWHDQLWNLCMLEMWFRTFIDTRPPLPDAVGGDETSVTAPAIS